MAVSTKSTALAVNNSRKENVDHIAQIVVACSHMQAMKADASIGIDRPIQVQIRSDVPVQGKKAFTMFHLMTAPLRELMDALESKFGCGTSTMRFVTDTYHLGEKPLPMERSLFDLGFEFPPLLTLIGYRHEIFVETAGLDGRLVVPWSPQATVTDVLKAIYLKYKPKDLRWIRLSNREEEEKNNSGGDADENEREGANLPQFVPRANTQKKKKPRYLRTDNCFRYPPDSALPMDVTLKELGLVQDPSFPCAVRFRRTLNGEPLDFWIPHAVGSTTIQSIADQALGLGELDPLEVDAHLATHHPRTGNTPPPQGVPSTGTAGGAGGGATRVEDVLPSFMKEGLGVDGCNGGQGGAAGEEAHNNLLVFDDENEEVSPLGIRTVYFHGVYDDRTEPDLPRDQQSQRVLSSKPAGKRNAPRSHEKPTAGSGVLLSFNPPESDVAAKVPTFVTIDEDYTVQHLSDCGIFPFSTILFETFNPLTQQWSGDLDMYIRGAQLLGGSPTPSDCYDPDQEACAEQVRQKRKAAAVTARDAVHQSNPLSPLGPNVDLLTVKTERGSTVRVPCCPHSQMSTVLYSVWCATGDIPDFCVLQTDTGRLVKEWQPLVDTGLFPQATLHLVHRPRPWLKETGRAPVPPTSRRALDVPEPSY